MKTLQCLHDWHAGSNFRSSVFGLAAFLLLASACAAQQQPETSQSSPRFPETKRKVMTWVPPYGVGRSKARLKESFDGVGMKDGLTHLGLQFWAPTPDGAGLQRVRRGDDTSDAAVGELRDWGHANGVRVLLCVYNYNTKTNSWDWPLARRAFSDHAKEFTASLVAEVDRLGLDGVDLDLEGTGSLDADKDAYLRFTRELSSQLHAKGKHLTVDTFAYVWHAPNQKWWKELFPLVDGINSMGYEELGSGAPEWRAFSAQEAASGDDVAKLMIGMPAHRNSWRGNATLEHLRWLRDKGKAGMSLWDSQLGGAQWRTRDAWSTIQEIRGAK